MQFLFYMLLVAGIGYFAKSKGRSPIGWALIALFISPLLAGIILFFLKNLNTGRYDGDTIDTTARPVPDESPRRAPERNNVPRNKQDIDVEESIRRMEDKLAQGKIQEDMSSSAANMSGVASVATADTVFSDKTENEMDVVENVEPEIIETSTENSHSDQVDTNASTSIQATVVEDNPAPAQAFCESCGQPLTPGGKFCTNCGTPVAK